MLVVEIKRDRWQELMKSKILYCSMIKIWKMSSQKLEIHLIKLGGMNIYFFLAFSDITPDSRNCCVELEFYEKDDD